VHAQVFVYVSEQFHESAPLRNRPSEASSGDKAYLLSRFWTGRVTIANGFAYLAGPLHNSFQTVVATANATAAGFKGLQNDPEDGHQNGNGPHNYNEQDDP
jgi:hypothetical protein